MKKSKLKTILKDAKLIDEINNGNIDIDELENISEDFYKNVKKLVKGYSKLKERNKELLQEYNELYIDTHNGGISLSAS